MHSKMDAEQESALLTYLGTPKSSRPTQREFAEKLKVPPYTVSRWLKSLQRERREASRAKSQATMTPREILPSLPPTNGSVLPDQPSAHAQEPQNAQASDVVDSPESHEARKLVGMVKSLVGDRYVPSEVEEAEAIITQTAKSENDRNLGTLVHKIFADAHNMGVELYMRYWPLAQSKGFGTVSDYITTAVKTYDQLVAKLGDVPAVTTTVRAFQALKVYAVVQNMKNEPLDQDKVISILVDPEQKEFKI